MNTRRIYPPAEVLPEVKADIERIMELWAQARARYGGDGDFLFGSFSAADIMYAPVVTRFITYSLPVAQFAIPYMQAVIAHPFMQAWIAAAQAEEWVIEKFEGTEQG
jgi:glutathione S-transferase